MPWPTIREQLEKRFGSPKSKQTALKSPRLEMLSFESLRPDRRLTIVSSGASVTLQPRARRIELMAQFHGPDRLLKSFSSAVTHAALEALFAKKDNGIAVGTFIDVCPNDLKRVGFECFVVAPAIFLPLPARTLQFVPGREVDILSIVPLFANERRFVERHGVEAFLNRAKLESKRLHIVQRDPVAVDIDPDAARDNPRTLNRKLRPNARAQSYEVFPTLLR